MNLFNVPIVLNRKCDKIPHDAVLVDRTTKWGNPFKIGADGNREEVIKKYLQYLRSNDTLLSSLHELKDKNLVCWCAPKKCHADILLRMSNG